VEADMEASEAAGVAGIEKRMSDFMGTDIVFDFCGETQLYHRRRTLSEPRLLESEQTRPRFGASIVPLAHRGFFFGKKF